MDKSFNRDNFDRLGVDKNNNNKDKVLERALGEHDSKDKENDTKKNWKK